MRLPIKLDNFVLFARDPLAVYIFFPPAFEFDKLTGARFGLFSKLADGKEHPVGLKWPVA